MYFLLFIGKRGLGPSNIRTTTTVCNHIFFTTITTYGLFCPQLVHLILKFGNGPYHSGPVTDIRSMGRSIIISEQIKYVQWRSICSGNEWRCHFASHMKQEQELKVSHKFWPSRFQWLVGSCYNCQQCCNIVCIVTIRPYRSCSQVVCFRCSQQLDFGRSLRIHSLELIVWP